MRVYIELVRSPWIFYPLDKKILDFCFDPRDFDPAGPLDQNPLDQKKNPIFFYPMDKKSRGSERALKLPTKAWYFCQ